MGCGARSRDANGKQTGGESTTGDELVAGRRADEAVVPMWSEQSVVDDRQ